MTHRRQSDDARRKGTSALCNLSHSIGSGAMGIQIMELAKREQTGLTNDLHVVLGVGTSVHRLQLVL
jgi:hypothetical protein